MLLLLRSLVLTAVVLAGCEGCGAVQEPPPSGPPEILSLGDQEALTVKLHSCVVGDDGEIELITGSGVIVSPRHVVTALHVVSGCPALEIELADGKRYAAEVELFHRRDLARLTLSEDVPSMPVLAGEPHAGQSVCFTPGTPSRILECGDVRRIDWDGWRGEIRLNVKVQHGNSGSPVWNAMGEMIGVVVTCDTLFPGSDVCLPMGGAATSLVGARWLVEDVDLR